MEHVVFFPAPDGSPAFRRVAGFDEAVRFVEHLRNVDNVTGASVHTLTEVPLSFRAWYRVELPSASGEIAASADVQEQAAPAELADVEVHDELEAPAELRDIEAPADVEVPAALADVAPSTDDEAADEVAAPAAELGAQDAAPEASDEEFLVGSTTAVLVPVPDQGFAPSDPYGVVPIAAASLSQPFGENIVESPTPEPELEHAAGGRRDRGLGFFAR